MIRQLLAAAIGNAFALLLLILLAFGLLGPTLLWILKVVLETIDNL